MNTQISEKHELMRKLTQEGSVEEMEVQMRLAVSIFEKYDSNKSGFIEKHEVMPILVDTYKILRRVKNLDNSDVISYIKMMDTDKDGKISMDE